LPCGNYFMTGGSLSTGSLSNTISGFQITGGTVTGTGTLSCSSAYDVQAGTVNAILGGGVGLNKTGTGTATVNSPTYSGTTSVQTGTLVFTGGLPGGNYAISGGSLSTGTLSKTISGFQITGGTVSGTGTLTNNTSAYAVRAGTVNPILAGSVGLTKSGSGMAILAGANTYAGTTVISNGTLTLVNNAKNVVFNQGGADIQAGDLVFNYGTGTDPWSDILSILDAGYGDGTLPFATGKIRSSTAASAKLALGWKDDSTTTSVDVMYTVYGDADLNGVVGASDLGLVLTNFGKSGVWSTGDFDYNGVVGASDLGMVLTNFGKSAPVVVDVSSYPGLDAEAVEILTDAGISVVPEPSSLMLLAACLAALPVCAWRKRR